MKKLISATAVCALAVGLVAVPGALGAKSAKQVGGTVSVAVTPSPLADNVTTVTASGNVASNSSCRKDRRVHFYWVVNGVQSGEVGTPVTTRSNGDYTATVPRPTQTSTSATSAVLRAIVDPVTRKVGSKKKGKKTKKGRRFDCLQLTGDSAPISLVAPTV